MVVCDADDDVLDGSLHLYRKHARTPQVDKIIFLSPAELQAALADARLSSATRIGITTLQYCIYMKWTEWC